MGLVAKYFSNFMTGVDTVITSMDSSQWGIFAAIMVIVGFMALRSRI